METLIINNIIFTVKVSGHLCEISCKEMGVYSKYDYILNEWELSEKKGFVEIPVKFKEKIEAETSFFETIAKIAKVVKNPADVFVKELLEKIPEKRAEITDDVFVMIENNPEQLKEYERLVAKDKKSDNPQRSLNGSIARSIISQTSGTILEKNYEPASKLIESYNLLEF